MTIESGSRRYKNLALFGVDPGKATGLAFLRVRPDGEVVQVAQVTVVPVDVPHVLGGWLATTPRDWERAVACERFTSGRQAARNTPQPDAERVYGVVEAECIRYGARFVAQAPGDAKNLVSNALLKKLGWYEATSDHAADATRHALKLLADTRATAFVRLLETAGWVGQA